MKSKRVCSQCHSSKYYCKGLCKKCYNKQFVPSKWSIKFDVCTNCKSSKYPHVAKGLCRRCYSTQTTTTLCACGCGKYVSKLGNKVRKYLHGHRINEQWKDPKYIKFRKGLFSGNKNPQYGKFGKNHPAYKHKKTKKFKKESSQRILKRISERTNKSTDIEIILSKLLDSMNIGHTSQTLLHNKFVVDTES